VLAPAVPAPRELEGKRVANTRQRHTAVHELLAKGMGVQAIAETLRLDRKTVRRYAKADSADQMLAVAPRRKDSSLRPWLAHLHQRWNEGCVDAARLHEEVRALGYRGSQRSVRRWLQPLRASGQAALPVPEGPSVRSQRLPGLPLITVTASALGPPCGVT
jgi:hypothetical protein